MCHFDLTMNTLNTKQENYYVNEVSIFNYVFQIFQCYYNGILTFISIFYRKLQSKGCLTVIDLKYKTISLSSEYHKLRKCINKHLFNFLHINYSHNLNFHILDLYYIISFGH